jgi:ATP/maltotriose-dependent transcriptional regulator MalT
MTAKGATNLKRGRDSIVRREWTAAFEQLSAARAHGATDPDDLVLLAMAAYLTGRTSESFEALTHAHREFLDRGDVAKATRSAFWIGFQMIDVGEMAQAAGWFARARRVLDDAGLESVEEGYLLIPVAFQSLTEGDVTKSYETFSRIGEIGDRFDDWDLVALARVGHGQILIARGETQDGLALLDEVMVAVTSNELSVPISGIVYCAVIEACQQIFDHRRAQEWTEALSDWCASQPDLVPFRGQCLIHRAEVLQLHGAWRDAMEEATRARERLSDSGEQAVGMAYYRLAEIHRLRGEYATAEIAFANANEWGHPPQPGLALLHLAQGQTNAALAAIRHALDEAGDRAERAKVLPAYVEITLAAGDLGAARSAADELIRMAREIEAPLIQAIADHANGEVFLAAGDGGAALGPLRRAWSTFHELDAPHNAARVRVLIALAYRALGDEGGGQMELEAARRVFEQLGAAPDRAHVETLLGAVTPHRTAGLTGREVEVLAELATGKSNREIAADLVISEKTVARHVSNIFSKLNVSSRAAATAYAFKHDLA